MKNMILLSQFAVCMLIASTCSAFTTPMKHMSSPMTINNQPHVRQQSSYSSSSSALEATPVLLAAAAAVVPNPFKKLPWNVRKEREREMRRLKLERARLHRELGIVEDATYEEIVAATDNLIAKAGSDLKRKIQIEVAKDKILQIRLNERLAGLAAASKDAKAQSSFEVDGDDDDLIEKKKSGGNEWNAPAWTQGLIVKPNKEHVNKQIKIWGIATMIGVALPPAQDYLGRFTWLICIAQLTFRGMPRDQLEGGGMGMAFMRSSGGSHRKLAWALGFMTWVGGAILVYGLMPSWAKGQRYTKTIGFTMQNLIFGVVCSYLQPYKGK